MAGVLDEGKGAPSESKSERFHRVAERRVNNALNALRLLEQCSNRRMYEYSDEEVRKMFREIDRELRRIKDSFYDRQTRNGFTFPHRVGRSGKP